MLSCDLFSFGGFELGYDEAFGGPLHAVLRSSPFIATATTSGCQAAGMCYFEVINEKKSDAGGMSALEALRINTLFGVDLLR